MFCTEMDGLEALQNVVVILASNRADLIDPAILRPGRIDRKIRVRRPDKTAAREIYLIYLGLNLPLAEPREHSPTPSSRRTTPVTRQTASWMSPSAAAGMTISIAATWPAGPSSPP